MMNSSPLHLESYFITKVHVEACPEGHHKNTGEKISANVECMQHNKDPHKWMVTLCVYQNNSNNKAVPNYLFEVEIVGFFDVAPGYDSDKTERLVKTNGPAVLFGSVREIVAMLTARGPFAAVTLPTVNFLDASTAKQPSPPKRKTPRIKKKSGTEKRNKPAL